MSNIKILSITLIIIGNVLLGGCSFYKGINYNLNNNESFNQEGLSVFEYNEQFMNSYKKYIEPLYIEEYDNTEKFFENQGLTSNKGYIEEYKELLEIYERHISGFKKDMNNLVMRDIELTDLNNELVKNSENLITEINTKKNEIKDMPKEKYSLETESFIDYIQSNFKISETITNKFENSIRNISHYLNIELNI
ncbi:hypothetical protein LZ906_011100 [Paraclostridium ghonii]|uniref:hypothetical protein n=1 Tax=Paraclostridium ghonii TaxID=29358 RepID=UPI00202CE840|nr:hypothetical protein [Paeniclostridium ghonii]MCM0165990.1 hypothetical protein [Paeniclostridium ghonii]